MKKIFLLALPSLIWTTGFSQNLSFKFGTPFRRSDLDVRWNVPSNALPPKVWIYHLLPNTFSPDLMSNLIALGSFTQADRVRTGTNAVQFKSPDNSRNLWVSYPLGAIRYQTLNNYGPTNLAKDVPEEAELLELTTNFLQRIGIKIGDIEKKADGAPDFHFWEPLTMFSVNQTIITNIGFRAVNFRRSVDGASFVGNGAGGDSELQFGEHGKISKIWLSWRNIERQKAFSSADPTTMVKWIRDGKAVQGMIRMDAEPINWKAVKSVTIASPKLCYYAGDPFTPSDWLVPFAALWTTVDTGHGNIDVEIDCPVVDQKSLLLGRESPTSKP